MPKNQHSKKKTESDISKKPFFRLGRKNKIWIGSLLMILGLAMAIAFTSYLLSWKQDYSELHHLERDSELDNWLSVVGVSIGNFFIERGLGIASYIIASLIFLTGLHLFFNRTKGRRLIGRWFWGLYLSLWLSITMGFLFTLYPLLSGVIGYELNDLLSDFMGRLGTGLLLLFFLILYLVVRIGLTPEQMSDYYKNKKGELQADLGSYETTDLSEDKIKTFDQSWTKSPSDLVTEKKVSAPTIENYSDLVIKRNDEIQNEKESSGDLPKDIEITVEEIKEEKDTSAILSDQLIKDFGEFDPTLELGGYRSPPLDLLKEYSDSGITINEEELEENKNRIVTTLRNYKIEIDRIKATIGPTVTLYEIVPEAGVRIAKIKNLEDDIALSLSALGIRIIAPIPGKGTIGIEVPNQKPSVVSMRSVIASPKFQNAEMALPMALGKTISNETFVVDLTKMPHLLMAGATGQGKSVGLNAILTSLLYKKHPAEVKFVLVDPKKVELTLFNKIERHYLAKLPGDEEAIITDTHKVIKTLNSLCIEMDTRYELLKNAMVRNIKEYNTKFKARKLNPNEGHRYLPYIILVIDEFADLIMTAGKELETPIARLAQLARAIGIHLIIATQRPSVNVITGIIKANFPARIAFRVTSKIDSRTILDYQGADQLIGRGDMLFTQGSELLRLQCAFIDTPEISKITEFIGSQRAYPEAYSLPEVPGDDTGSVEDFDLSDRDPLFREAAEVIVTAQQGSASLLQRKLKLGYNRAGRLIDQLEHAGIVGPFEGSKARQVMFSDLNSLESYLSNRGD